MSIITKFFYNEFLLVQYFCVSEVTGPEETPLPTLYVLLLDASLQANEDMSVIYYPLSKRDDQLCHMETICIFWSPAKLVQMLAPSLMCCVNMGTLYLRKPPSQQTAYVSVCFQGEAN